MSCLSHAIDYWSNGYPGAGGLEFVALVTGVNLALVGWENFTKKISDCEKTLELKVQAACASLRDANVDFLKVVCRFIVSDKLIWLRRLAWNCNYLLAIAALLVGLAVLYLGIVARSSVLLTLPLLLQLFLSWGPHAFSIALIKVVTFFSPKLSKVIKQMREDELSIAAKTTAAEKSLEPHAVQLNLPTAPVPVDPPSGPRLRIKY